MTVLSLVVCLATPVMASVMALILLEKPSTPIGPVATTAAAAPKNRRRVRPGVADLGAVSPGAPALGVLSPPCCLTLVGVIACSFRVGRFSYSRTAIRTEGRRRNNWTKVSAILSYQLLRHA